MDHVTFMALATRGLVSRKPRYTLVGVDPGVGIRCETCGHTSWNPNDVAQRYCGYCHVFLEEETNANRDPQHG